LLIFTRVNRLARSTRDLLNVLASVALAAQVGLPSMSVIWD
jgi:hypothetical protein